MRRTIIGLTLIIFISFIGAAAALTPDVVLLSTDKEWLVAGSSETATVQVRVMNLTPANITDPVTGAVVTLACEDTLMCMVVTANPQTVGGPSQNVTFTIRPGTKSGDAVIRATVTYPGLAVPLTNTTIQKIDHAEPKFYEQVLYPTSGTVNTDATIEVRMVDRYGNLVDDRRIAEPVTFQESASGDGGFWNGTVLENTYLAYVNGTGYANVTYRMDTQSGENVIQVIAPPTVVSNIMYITIMGTPDIPLKITSRISSDYDKLLTEPHAAVANGIDKFLIYYDVVDQYDNPVPDAQVSWHSYINGTVEFEKTFTTNYQGQIYLEYGPSTIIHDVEIKGEMVGGDDEVDTLKFVSGGPAIFTVSPNPQTIASRDANINSTSYIQARLLDSIGRGIAGEQINFTIYNEVASSVTRNSSFNFADETIDETSAVTNQDGVAVAVLYPAAFPLFGQPGYSTNANGTAFIQASWQNLTLDMNETGFTKVVYKNYPYLRVETYIEPTTVNINETVNVTIKLVGDGFTPRKPIDVIFANSRTASMAQEYPDRILSTRQAARIITQNLTFQFNNETYDRAGLWTFSDMGQADLLDNSPNWENLVGHDSDKCDTSLPYPEACTGTGKNRKENHTWVVNQYYPGNDRLYSDYATCDTGDLSSSSLVTERAPVETAIDNIVPYLSETNVEHGASLRYGIYTSVTDLIGHARPKAVKAVVVLIDQNYNWFGDPLGASGSSKDWDGDPKTSGSVWIKFPLGGPYTGLWGSTDQGTTWQNMSNYARDHDIRIYLVAYSSQINPNWRNTFIPLCRGSGGEYFEAPTEAKLFEAYERISELLVVPASVNTNMNMNFTSINVTYNEITEHIPGNQIFRYEYRPSTSTLVQSQWIKNGSIFAHPLPVPPYPQYTSQQYVVGLNTYTKYPYYYDQTNEWNSNALNFYIGNVSIGQWWSAKFTLNASRPGSIKLFGPDIDAAPICFENEEGVADCLDLPETYLTVLANYTEQPSFQNELDIIDGSLTVLPSGTIDLLNVSWLLNYTGTSTVRQIGYYQFSGDEDSWSGKWIQFSDKQTPNGPINSSTTWWNILDIRDRVGYLKIKIVAYEEVTPAGRSDEELLNGIIDIGKLRNKSILIR